MKYYLLTGLVFLISLIPSAGLVMLSRPLGWLVWGLSKTRRGTTLKNLEACYPNLNEAGRLQLARQSMRHFVLSILEVGLSWNWSLPRVLKHFDQPEGFELFEQAKASGRGVLLLIPHFGAWELSAQWLQHRCQVTALYKPGDDSGVNAKLLARRERFGTRMAPTTKAGLKTIYRELSEGGVVLQLPDQDPSAGQGKFIPFFGVPALTGVLAPRLIQRSGCSVLFLVCRRTPRGRFKMHFLNPDSAIYSNNLDEALSAVNLGVEQCIGVDPAQYLWAYKRFKTRPEGEPRFY